MKKSITTTLAFLFTFSSFAAGTNGGTGNYTIDPMQEFDYVPDNSYSDAPILNYTGTSVFTTLNDSFNFEEPIRRADAMETVESHESLHYQDEEYRGTSSGPIMYADVMDSPLRRTNFTPTSLQKLNPISAGIDMPTFTPISAENYSIFSNNSTPSFSPSFTTRTSMFQTGQVNYEAGSLDFSNIFDMGNRRERIACDNLAGDLLSLKQGQDEFPICSGMTLGDTLAEIENLTRQMSYYNVLQNNFLEKYSAEGDDIQREHLEEIIRNLAKERKLSSYSDKAANEEDWERAQANPESANFDNPQFALGREEEYLKEIGCNNFLAPECLQHFKSSVRDGKMPIVDAKIALIAKELEHLAQSVRQYQETQAYQDFKEMREYLMAEIELNNCKEKWDPIGAMHPSDYLTKVESSICQRQESQYIYGEQVSELANDMTNIVRALERQNIESEKSEIASSDQESNPENFQKVEQCARIMKHSNDFIMRCEFFLRGGDYNNPLNVNLEEVDGYEPLTCNYGDSSIALTFQRDGYQDDIDLRNVQKALDREFIKNDFHEATDGLSLQEKIIVAHNEAHRKGIEDLVAKTHNQNPLYSERYRDELGLRCGDFLELSRMANINAGAGDFTLDTCDESNILQSGGPTYAGLIEDLDSAGGAINLGINSGNNLGGNGNDIPRDDDEEGQNTNLANGSASAIQDSNNPVNTNNQDSTNTGSGLNASRRAELLNLPHISELRDGACAANEDKVNGLCVVRCPSNFTRLPASDSQNPYGCVVDSATVQARRAAENEAYRDQYKRKRNLWIGGSAVAVVGLGVGAMALGNNGYQAGQNAMSNRLANNAYTSMYSGSGYGNNYGGGFGFGSSSASSFYGARSYSNYGTMSGVNSFFNGGAGTVFDPTGLRRNSSVYFPYQVNRIPQR
tara:strand:- start:250618 stop:253350 length:2733 start_codon:yes stop_codon:yes gene_type:complete